MVGDGAEWVAAHKARQVERGLRRVSVWVPERDVAELRTTATQMRARAELLLPADEKQAVRSSLSSGADSRLNFARAKLERLEFDLAIERTRVVRLERQLAKLELPVQSTTQPNQKTGRNAPCPCGSGKKYKRCCGR